MQSIATDVFFFRIVLAIVLGLIVGLDRQIKHAPVGMRTFALVSMGSAAYTLLTLELAAAFEGGGDNAVDPSRLIQGLIGGIGFLGAGAIIGGTSGAAGQQVRGIATGAAIWVAGAVGVACGLGFYGPAAILAAVTSALLVVTELIEAKWGHREKLVRDEPQND